MKQKTLLCLLLVSATVLTNTAPAAAAKKAALPRKKLTLYEGQKKAITIKNKNKKAAYTFTSSSPKRASVSKKGVITAKKQGKTKITVKEKLKSGSKKNIRKVGVITVTVQKRNSRSRLPLHRHLRLLRPPLPQRPRPPHRLRYTIRYRLRPPVRPRICRRRRSSQPFRRLRRRICIRRQCLHYL